jgi:hypothetical protein
MNKTKKELILEIFSEEGFEELGDEEIRRINERLVAVYGRGGAASAAFMANTLIAAGKTIRYKDSFETTSSPDGYAEDFAGLLNFDTLAAAERSILTIDRFFRRFRAEGDDDGAARCRQIADRGRLRARLIASNDRVAPEKRAEKEEMAFWFDLWLRTPDLFEDWIELRKNSPDYRRRFPEATVEQD